ncbi:hypothetical protein JCM10207_007409 [Rhodosporidiobolus poonsookiae]
MEDMDAADDPERWSPQERTDELEAVCGDGDILAALYLLTACSKDEVNACSSDAKLLCGMSVGEAESWLTQAGLLGDKMDESAPASSPTLQSDMEIEPDSDEEEGADTTVKPEPMEENDSAALTSAPQAAPQPSSAPPLSDRPSPETKPVLDPSMTTPPVESSPASNSGPPFKVLLTPIPATLSETVLQDVVNTVVDPSSVERIVQQPSMVPHQASIKIVSRAAAETAASGLNGTFFNGTELHARINGSSSRSRSRSPSRNPSRAVSRPLSPNRPSPRGRTPSPATEPASWLYVNRLPNDISERRLYEVLHDRHVAPEDVHVQPQQPQKAKSTLRIAYVGFRSQDEASAGTDVLLRHLASSRSLSVHPFRASSGSTTPNISAPRRRRYHGPARNAAHVPDPPHQQLVFRHLKHGMTERALSDFIERNLGADCARECDIARERTHRAETHAFVKLDTVERAREAILKLDGEVWNGMAMSVHWAGEPDKPANDERPPPFSAEPADSRSLSSSNVEPLGATNRYSRGPSIPSRPVDPALPPSPPRSRSRKPSPSPIRDDTPPRLVAPASSNSPSTALERDRDRLRAIGMSPADVASMERIWAPLDAPPAGSDPSLASSFSRSVEVKVDFGFLPRREAKLALDANEDEAAFPDDPVKQMQYEAFLKAQAGESRDWYTIFCARLAEFSQLAAVFADRGHKAATDST